MPVSSPTLLENVAFVQKMYPAWWSGVRPATKIEYDLEVQATMRSSAAAGAVTAARHTISSPSSPRSRFGSYAKVKHDVLKLLGKG